MYTKRRTLFAPLLLLALLALFSTHQTFVRAGNGDGTPSLGVVGTRVQASQNIDPGTLRRGAAQDYSEQVRTRNQQTRGRGQSTQPRQQPSPSTVARPDNQRRQREVSVPVRQNPVRIPVARTTRTRITNNVNIPPRPIVRNPRSGVNFANTVNTATQVGRVQKAFKIRKTTMPSEFRSLRLPKATYGYELEGYHTNIFKFIKPKNPTQEQEKYDSWTPQQRAENYLTQAVPKAKFNLDVIEHIPLLKKRLVVATNPGQFGDYEAITPTEFPFNQWEKLYTEYNDDAMWEIVSLPFNSLNEMFKNLIDTMQKTGQKDKFYRVQINVFTDEIENWDKLVSLVASSNFALAFAGNNAAVMHKYNFFPAAYDFQDGGLYDRPFEEVNSDTYKTRLVAIRKAPNPDSNKKMVRIEFRAIPNQRSGECIIRNLLASAITADDNVNTFGECVNAEIKKCSAEVSSAGIKTPTVSKVKEWSQKHFPSDYHSIRQSDYDKAVMKLKNVAVTHPAWGTSSAANLEFETKTKAADLVSYVQCLLAAAATVKHK